MQLIYFAYIDNLSVKLPLKSKMHVVGVVTITVFVLATMIASSVLLLQSANAAGRPDQPRLLVQAPIATSWDKNVYVAWPSNKTGNDEVIFKTSTDDGKTFGNKMNLSNSSKSDSQAVQIAALGNNVYVSWWERNATSNEPVLTVSNDNGKTFGEK